MSWRRSTWIWIAITTSLVAMVIQLVLALSLINIAGAQNWKPPRRYTTTLNIFGIPAEDKPWPAPPAPGQTAWPPNQYTRTRTWWLVDHKQAWSSRNNGLFQMDSIAIGFPLPVVQQVRRWWPWEDPAWKADNKEATLSWQFQPIGLLVNTAATALPAILILLVIFALPAWLRRRKRLRTGLCPDCGYDIRGQTRCPECGRGQAPAPA